MSIIGDGGSYVNEVVNALANCASPNGLFVFTSSGGVFTENSGGMVDEDSDVVSSGDQSVSNNIGKYLMPSNCIFTVFRFH